MKGIQAFLRGRAELDMSSQLVCTGRKKIAHRTVSCHGYHTLASVVMNILLCRLYGHPREDSA